MKDVFFDNEINVGKMAYNFVDLIRLASVNHLSGHNDGLFLAEDQTFDKIVFLAFRDFGLEELKNIKPMKLFQTKLVSMYGYFRFIVFRNEPNQCTFKDTYQSPSKVQFFAFASFDQSSLFHIPKSSSI